MVLLRGVLHRGACAGFTGSEEGGGGGGDFLGEPVQEVSKEWGGSGGGGDFSGELLSEEEEWGLRIELEKVVADVVEGEPQVVE